MRVLYKVAICIVCLVGCFWGRTYPAFDAHVFVHTSDLSTGGILDALDLSPIADTDGLPEASMMARDGNHLFVQVQRLDRNASYVPVPPFYLAVIDIEAFELIDVDPGFYSQSNTSEPGPACLRHRYRRAVE